MGAPSLFRLPSLTNLTYPPGRELNLGPISFTTLFAASLGSVSKIAFLLERLPERALLINGSIKVRSSLALASVVVILPLVIKAAARPRRSAARWPATLLNFLPLRKCCMQILPLLLKGNAEIAERLFNFRDSFFAKAGQLEEFLFAFFHQLPDGFDTCGIQGI